MESLKVKRNIKGPVLIVFSLLLFNFLITWSTRSDWFIGFAFMTGVELTLFMVVLGFSYLE